MIIKLPIRELMDQCDRMITSDNPPSIHDLPLCFGFQNECDVCEVFLYLQKTRWKKCHPQFHNKGKR